MRLNIHEMKQAAQLVLDWHSYKLISFVLSLEQRSHISKNHFKDLNWLPVQQKIDQITLCHVFKIKHGLARDYMSEHFVS